GLRRDARRQGQLTRGQGPAIEERRHHRRPRRVSDPRRDLGDDGTGDHVRYLTPKSVDRHLDSRRDLPADEAKMGKAQRGAYLVVTRAPPARGSATIAARPSRRRRSHLEQVAIPLSRQDARARIARSSTDPWAFPQLELHENGAKWPLTFPVVSSQLIPKACMWPRDAFASARRVAAGCPTLSRRNPWPCQRAGASQCRPDPKPVHTGPTEGFKALRRRPAPCPTSGRGHMGPGTSGQYYRVISKRD